MTHGEHFYHLLWKDKIRNKNEQGRNLGWKQGSKTCLSRKSNLEYVNDKEEYFWCHISLITNSSLKILDDGQNKKDDNLQL